MIEKPLLLFWLAGWTAGGLFAVTGLQTLKFCAGIDEAEGRVLIEALKVNPNFKEVNFA